MVDENQENKGWAYIRLMCVLGVLLSVLFDPIKLNYGFDSQLILCLVVIN